jgi:hypothetical protein
MAPDESGFPTDAEFQAEVARRDQLASEERARVAAERAANVGPDESGFPTDAEFQAEVARRDQLASEERARVAAERAANVGPEMDHYYAVKTGDTFDSIAEDLGHKGDGQALLDASHGAETNGEIAAGHNNRTRGADGERTDANGAIIQMVKPENVTTRFKLIEGQSLLLPKGW